MVIMSGCSSVTRSFNSSCLFVMLLIFSCRSVKSFWLGCDVVACECVVELSVVVWVVRAEGGSLRFWGPGLLSTSPAFSMSSASHSAGSSGWLAQKTGAGPTYQWAGKVDAICRSRSNRAKRPRAGCILRSCVRCSLATSTNEEETTFVCSRIMIIDTQLSSFGKQLWRICTIDIDYWLLA